MKNLVLKFNEIGINDVGKVGGKNASLGEMIGKLSSKDINVPNGFATTADAFWYFLDHNNLRNRIYETLKELNKETYSNLAEIGEQVRGYFANAVFPDDLRESILAAYKDLCGPEPFEVAVRSSATAEDLPQASFAGQHESYLNVLGNEALLEAVKKCFTSLFTNRAIKYREDNGFKHEAVALSAGIQKMVRSDKACSGVGFTLEPESGFRNVVHLSGAWGLGENVVQGTVTPDEFIIFKPSLVSGKNAIIQKQLGEKAKMMIYGDKSSTVNVDTPHELRVKFVLTEEEINTIARWAMTIEEHYKKPMDIEWAKDGLDNKLYIVQARPETVHSNEDSLQLMDYELLQKGEVITNGQAIGNKIASGTARILHSMEDADRLNEGDIVVTELTSPDWDPILKKARAIVTDKGGRTSHASIVAREIGIPAVVGTGDGTKQIKDGDIITVSCSQGKTGFIYSGELKWKETKLDFKDVKMPRKTKVMMITGDPGKAFKLSFYPNNGVGLVRIEFIINHAVQVHPMALARFNDLKDTAVKQEIERVSDGYIDKKQFFIDKLSQGVATIAAAFYPKDVIVRMSDFKSNEYASLLGGEAFEPEEENPMIGFRGASRYYNPRYKEGFQLECEAMKVVRNEMGLTNVKLMIPFCRTVEEGKKVVETMNENGLKQGENGLEIYVMAEVPSNVLQTEDFAEVFDGFSIGSNDLTQLTLGIDRDSALIADLFDEQNKAAKKMIAMVIANARDAHKPIGLCGQAPSDFPEFAQFLVEQQIDSISFNPDALMNGIENINKAEQLFYGNKVQA